MEAHGCWKSDVQKSSRSNWRLVNCHASELILRHVRRRYDNFERLGTHVQWRGLRFHVFVYRFLIQVYSTGLFFACTIVVESRRNIVCTFRRRVEWIFKVRIICFKYPHRWTRLMCVHACNCSPIGRNECKIQDCRRYSDASRYRRWNVAKPNRVVGAAPDGGAAVAVKTLTYRYRHTRTSFLNRPDAGCAEREERTPNRQVGETLSRNPWQRP